MLATKLIGIAIVCWLAGLAGWLLAVGWQKGMASCWLLQKSKAIQGKTSKKAVSYWLYIVYISVARAAGCWLLLLVVAGWLAIAGWLAKLQALA